MYTIAFVYCPLCQKQHFVEMHFLDEENCRNPFYCCPKTGKTFLDKDNLGTTN